MSPSQLGHSSFGYSSFRRLLTAVALSAVLIPAGAFGAERVWTQTYSLSSGGSLSLSNINGDVTIRGTDRADVSVTATITSDSESGLDRVDVKVDTSSNHIQIETDYSKKKGRWGNSGASVHYELEVPSSIELEEIDLVNGSLQLSDIDGDVEANLVNGSLNAEGLGGSAELETVNGQISATFNRMGSSQRVDLESVNGSIELRIPDDAGATVEASTVHGKIRNDFGMKVERGEYVGSDMEGKIGDGGARISLENVNGSINVRRP